jgi:hypothetical protein
VKDDVRAFDAAPKRVAVVQVAVDKLDAERFQPPPIRRRSRQTTDARPRFGQPFRQPSADKAGRAGDEKRFAHLPPLYSLVNSNDVY